MCSSSSSVSCLHIPRAAPARCEPSALSAYVHVPQGSFQNPRALGAPSPPRPGLLATRSPKAVSAPAPHPTEVLAHNLKLSGTDPRHSPQLPLGMSDPGRVQMGGAEAPRGNERARIPQGTAAEPGWVPARTPPARPPSSPAACLQLPCPVPTTRWHLCHARTRHRLAHLPTPPEDRQGN